MKGKTSWGERPHRYVFEDEKKVSICRLAPGYDSLKLEWLDPERAGSYRLEWRAIYAGEDWQSRRAEGTETVLEGLMPYRDYEVRVNRERETGGEIRYFRTGFVPGTVINYLHPKDLRYAFSGHALCSPCLIRLPSGRLLASMDVYRGGGPQNLSLLFRSDDRGKNWNYVCDLYPLFWGDMFLHRGRLYMIGCSTEFGDILIGVSDDEGESWSAPVRLFAGSCTVGDGWEQSPMPVVTYRGRIYVSCEYAGRNIGRRPCILSASEEADLCDPASWSVTKPYEVKRDCLSVPGSVTECFIEGNLFVSPEGDLRCMYRVDAEGIDTTDGKSAVLRVPQDPEGELEMIGFISMPAGYNNKFMMRYDGVSGDYFAVGNLPTDGSVVQQRNVLALFRSPDARNWRTVCRLIDGEKEPVCEVGYQYPSFIFDGNDILFQLRTAVNGAGNFHDANYSTFHVISDFRKL